MNCLQNLRLCSDVGRGAGKAATRGCSHCCLNPTRWGSRRPICPANAKWAPRGRVQQPPPPHKVAQSRDLKRRVPLCRLNAKPWADLGRNGVLWKRQSLCGNREEPSRCCGSPSQSGLAPPKPNDHPRGPERHRWRPAQLAASRSTHLSAEPGAGGHSLHKCVLETPPQRQPPPN